MASIKQVAFIESLISEVDPTRVVDFDALSIEDASHLIGELRQMKAKFQVAEVLTEGMYQTADGVIYRVQKSRQSGHPYAKRLNALQNTFEFEGGAIRKLRLADKMTLEDAKAFGVATGVCCVCAAFLTDEKSVAAGIGPICAKKSWF